MQDDTRREISTQQFTGISGNNMVAGCRIQERKAGPRWSVLDLVEFHSPHLKSDFISHFAKAKNLVTGTSKEEEYNHNIMPIT